MEKIPMDELDFPDITFKLSAAKVRDVLAKIIMENDYINVKKRAGFLAKVFDEFCNVTDYVEPVKTVAKKKITPKNTDKHNFKLPFKQKLVSAIFEIDNGDDSPIYEYKRIMLKPSTIPQAGMGAYAYDPIPAGAKGSYIGEKLHEDDHNPYYSWVIKDYDPKTGDEKPGKGQIIFATDASNYKKGNWTRFVNCGKTSKDNNMDSQQEFDSMLYVAIRDIKKGEELFIDYGEAYRRDNLKLRGKY